VKDPDPIMSVSDADDVQDRLWAYEDFTAAQEHPSVDVTGTFASLGFLRAALRRTRRFWLLTAAIGFIVGIGIYVADPPSYSASTTLLVTSAPGTDPTTAMLTEQSLAESLPVAAAVVMQLGLNESPSSVLAAYTVTPVTDQVLVITAKAPSSAQAVQWAQAIGEQFLKFRTNLLNTQEQQEEVSLNAQVTQSQQSLTALGVKITGLGGTIPSVTSTTPSQSTSPSGQVGQLEAQYTAAYNKLQTLKQQVVGTIAQNQIIVTNQVDGSQVLNPATAEKHSKYKYVAYDIVTAVFAGFVLGMAIVVVQALISDRLRRRDDIAVALGVPVKLSVGPIKADRFSFSPRAKAARQRDIRRVATYLRKAAPVKNRGEAGTLAVLPIDNALTVVPAVIEMAEACAKEGLRVAVADLVKDAPLARALGVTEAGIRPVQMGDVRVIVVVPDPDDPAPSGPRRAAGTAPLAAPPDEDLLSAYRFADLFVTFVELDPALGSEHLATWATNAVAIVTAGATHGQKAYSVGELLRLSSVHVISAILVNADEGDESLGVDPALQELMAGNA
jgi:capsular polysaccharide biosynthesis protein